MALDIFNRPQQPVAGVFTSDSMVAVIASGTGSWAECLVQGIQLNYTQDFQELYELGSNNMYRAVGRCRGRMSIAKIIGKSTSDVVQAALYDACNTNGTMTLTATDTLCSDGAQLQLTLGGLFVNDYGFQVQVQDNIMHENLLLAFNFFARQIVAAPSSAAITSSVSTVTTAKVS